MFSFLYIFSNSYPSEARVIHEQTLSGYFKYFFIQQLSFRGAQQAVHELRGKVRHLLNLPHPDAHRNQFDPLANQMEAQVAQYLCKTAGNFDVLPTVEVIIVHLVEFVTSDIVDIE